MGYRLGVSKHSRRRPKVKKLAKLEVGRRVLLLTAGVTFLLLRVLQFLLAGRYPATYPDSDTYRVESGAWFDFSLVFAQARPALVTGFFALLPDDSTRVFVQWIISTTAWLVLLSGVVLLFKKMWVALLAATSTWVIGLSYYAIQWDSTILSESLSISALIFGLGFLIWWWATQTSSWAYLAIIAFGLSALNRPNLWLTLLGIFLIVAIVGKLIGQKRMQTFLMLGLTLLFLIAGLIQQQINDKNFSGEGDLDRIGWTYASMLSDESPIATALIPALVGSGAPACMIPRRPFTSENGPINLVNDLQNSCPKGVTWVNDNFLVWYAGFLVNKPIETLNALGDLVDPSTRVLPYGFDSKIEPPHALRDIFNLQNLGSAWSLLIVSLTAGLISLLALGLRRSNTATLGLLVIEIFLIASWAMGALLQVWDLHRTIVTNVIGVNLVAVLLIAAVLDNFASEPGKTA